MARAALRGLEGDDLRPRQAQAGDGLVDRAVGLGAGVVLGHATTEEQPGGAVVPLAGGDSAAADGRPARYQVRPASRGSQRSARSVTLTS